MGLRPQKKIRNSEFGVRNSEFGIQKSEFGIRNSEFGIVNSNGNNKLSHLGHRTFEHKYIYILTNGNLFLRKLKESATHWHIFVIIIFDIIWKTKNRLYLNEKKSLILTKCTMHSDNLWIFNLVFYLYTLSTKLITEWLTKSYLRSEN